MRTPQEQPTVAATWERRSETVNVWAPYVLLAISTVLALLGDQPPGERIPTFALAGLSAVWVFVMFTRSPEPRQAHRLRMVVYMVGLLALSGVLMSLHVIYFVFAITGFFHASYLRPWPLAIAAVFVTSTLIHTIITGFPWPTIDLWVLFGTVILIQTAAIGFGTVIGERLAELSEERRLAVVRLEGALEENAGLHRQLVEQAREAGVLDERGRMAREIHDTIAHGLTGIVTQLEAANQAADRAQDRQRHIDNALGLARESLSEARRSVEASRPEPLETGTLTEALAAVAEQWSSMNEVPIEVTTTGEPLALHPEIEVALLRTAQEALANVSRHAKATRAAVTLSYMGDVVTLDVRDDGVGFEVGESPTGRSGGFGLTAMRQRITRVAGSVAIESEPGGGTAISARVPAIGAQPAGPGS